MGKQGRYFPDLIQEYKQTLKHVRANGGNASIERDLIEAIKWMETGYDPANYRAITRIDAYVMDHHLMQNFIAYTDSEAYVPEWFEDRKNSDRLSWDFELQRMISAKVKINNAMEGLTDNERAVFVMIKAQLMTFSQVAKVLGISRSTVQSYLERAEQKIRMNIQYGSQLSLAI